MQIDDTYQIDKIEMSIMAPLDYRQDSVLGVGAMGCHNTTTDDVELISSGLLGSNSNIACKTCHPNSLNVCSGHPGHIELASCDLMYHHYAKHIYQLLSTVCFVCSKSLLLPNGEGTGARESSLDTVNDIGRYLPNVNKLHTRIISHAHSDFEFLVQSLRPKTALGHIELSSNDRVELKLVFPLSTSPAFLQWLTIKRMDAGSLLIQALTDMITSDKLGRWKTLSPGLNSADCTDDNERARELQTKLVGDFYNYALVAESMFAVCYACFNKQQTSKKPVNRTLLTKLQYIVYLLSCQLLDIDQIRCLTRRGVEDQFTWHEEQVYTLSQRCQALAHTGAKLFTRLSNKEVRTRQQTKQDLVAIAITDRRNQLEDAKQKLAIWRQLKEEVVCIHMERERETRPSSYILSERFIPVAPLPQMFTHRLEQVYKFTKKACVYGKKKTRLICSPGRGGCGSFQPTYHLCAKSLSIKATFVLPSEWHGHSSGKCQWQPMQPHVINPFLRGAWYNNWTGILVMDASLVSGILRRMPSAHKMMLTNKTANKAHVEYACTPVLSIPPTCIVTEQSHKHSFGRVANDNSTRKEKLELDPRMMILVKTVGYVNSQCKNITEIEHKLNRVWNRGEEHRTILYTWSQVNHTKIHSLNIQLWLNCIFVSLPKIGTVPEHSGMIPGINKGASYRKKLAQYISDNSPSLHQAINGKQGIVRLNLMGKNVNYSVRAVLGVRADLSIDECGIGGEIARRMFTKVVASRANLERVRAYVADVRKRRQLLRNQQLETQMSTGVQTIPNLHSKYVCFQYGDVWPCIGTITNSATDEKRLFSLRHSDYAYEKIIQIGDIIEVSIQDGDEIFMNRQPTLWRHGVASLRIKILNQTGCSFWLHPCQLLKFAADCDGDVMSAHVISHKWDRVHTHMSIGVQQDLCCAQTGASLLVFIQDQILLLYCMSSSRRQYNIHANQLIYVCTGLSYFKHDRTRLLHGGPSDWCALADVIKRELAINVFPRCNVTQADTDRAILRVLLALMLPDTLCYQHAGINIRNGIWIEGQFTSQHLGSSTNSLISCVYAQYGVGIALTLINDVTWITRHYAQNSGMGLSMINLLPCPTGNGKLNYWPQYQDQTNSLKHVHSRARQHLLCRSTTQNKQLYPARVLTVDTVYSPCQIDIWKAKAQQIIAFAETQNLMAAQTQELTAVGMAYLTQYLDAYPSDVSSDHNTLLDMVMCGSKGKHTDLSMLHQQGGLQLLDGQFLQGTGDGRALPHERTSHESIIGWCNSSLVQGMSAIETFYHLTTARKKLCDSSGQVHVSGALHRACLHMMDSYERNVAGVIGNRDGEVLMIDDGANYSGAGLRRIEIPINQFILNNSTLLFNSKKRKRRHTPSAATANSNPMAVLYVLEGLTNWDEISLDQKKQHMYNWLSAPPPTLDQQTGTGWQFTELCLNCQQSTQCISCSALVEATQKLRDHVKQLAGQYTEYLTYSNRLKNTPLSDRSMISPFDIRLIIHSVTSHSKNQTHNAALVCPITVLQVTQLLLYHMCCSDYPMAMSIHSTLSSDLIARGLHGQTHDEIDCFWMAQFKQRHGFLLLYVQSELSPRRIIDHYQLTRSDLNRVASAVLAAFTSSRCYIGENVGGVSVASHFEQVTQSVLSTKHFEPGYKTTATYTTQLYMSLLSLQFNKTPTRVSFHLKKTGQWPEALIQQCPARPDQIKECQSWATQLLFKTWCKLPGAMFFSSVRVTKYSTHPVLVAARNNSSNFTCIPIEKSSIDNNEQEHTDRRSACINMCLCLVVNQIECQTNNIAPCEFVANIIHQLNVMVPGETTAILDVQTQEVYIMFRPVIWYSRTRIVPVVLTPTEQSHFSSRLYNVGHEVVQFCSSQGPCDQVFFEEHPRHTEVTFVLSHKYIKPSVLKAMLCCPILDTSSLICNNPVLMESVFGICAASATLKILLLLCMKEFNSSMREEHADVFVSWMTRTGTLRPVTYKGLSTASKTKYKDCIFEQNAKSLHQSALNGVSSGLKDISSRLLVGKMLSPSMDVRL